MSESPKSTWALLLRFWHVIRIHRWWLFIGLLSVPLIAATGTWRPLLVKQAIDDHIPNGDLNELYQVAILFLVAVLGEFLFSAAQMYSLQRAGHSTIADLRVAIFRHILRLPARFFDRHPVGTLVSRTTSDVEALSETLSFGVFTIIGDVVMIGAMLVAMFVLNAKVALFSLSIAPCLFFVIRFFSQKLRKYHLEIRRAQGVQIGHLTEQLAGISVLQLFGRENLAHRRFSDLGQRYLKATKTANLFDAMLFSVMDGISAFCIALLLYIGSHSISDPTSGLSLGLMFAFVDYLQRIFVPIREFSGKLATVQRAAAALDRIYSLLDTPTERHPETSTEVLDCFSRWDGGLSVNNLKFRYSSSSPWVLEGISFEVKPGEVVAVVGRTGSGKTSLGRVLTQTYGDYQGSIALNIPSTPSAPSTNENPVEHATIELRSIPPVELRKQLLMVQQDVFLFDDSIAFNVDLGQLDLKEDSREMDQILETVQAKNWVMARGGPQSPVGERGKALSAGETQLLAFARVAARKPTMLVLDEATSNVDSETEQQVQKAIESLFHGRSVLVIAHRLSTVRHADKILVMEQGHIVEQGNHHSLMALQGVYADLYNRGFPEESDSDATKHNTKEKLEQGIPVPN